MKTAIRIEQEAQKSFLDELSREYAGREVNAYLMSSHIVALRNLGRARFIGVWLETCELARNSIMLMLESEEHGEHTHTMTGFTFVSWNNETLFVEHPDGSTDLVKF